MFLPSLIVFFILKGKDQYLGSILVCLSHPDSVKNMVSFVCHHAETGPCREGTFKNTAGAYKLEKQSLTPNLTG